MDSAIARREAPRRRWLAPLGIFLAALFLLGASGENGRPQQITTSGNFEDGQGDLAFRAGLSAVDTTTLAIVLATPSFDVQGRPNIPLSVRFSQASQTCKVTVYYLKKNGKVKDISDEVTLTGSARPDEDGNYLAPSYVFSSMGAVTMRFALTGAPGSGTVDFRPGSY